MSRDREEMLHQGLDAWNRGDLDGMLELVDPEVGIHLSGAFPGLETEYRGHDGLREFWREMHDMWSPLEMEAGEVELIDDLLLSPITFRATGRGDIQVERVFWFVWEIDPSSDLVVSYSSHRERAGALEAIKTAREKRGSRT